MKSIILLTEYEQKDYKMSKDQFETAIPIEF